MRIREFLGDIPLNKDDRKLAERILDLLTKERKLGNVTLQKNLQNPENYWEVRNLLINYGLLEKGKGKGGSVRLVELDRKAADTPPPAEKDLYEDLEETLRTAFAKEKGFQRAAVAVTANYAKKAGGQWEHPDLVLGGFKTLPFVYGNQQDLFSFEVKRYKASVSDLYEAAHHRRFVHYAYLLVCEAPGDFDWNVLGALASETGVGLISADNAHDFEGWEERIEPARNAPEPPRMNEFIAQRVTKEFQRRWRDWLSKPPDATSPL